MTGEWLGVSGEWRRTKTYWWSGGFAAIRQARPEVDKRRVNSEFATKALVRATGALLVKAGVRLVSPRR
jgi:hypothetical protein